MALSKKLRFEVFKRDDFTCQYCGKKPPSVVLEVDHIIPKCKSGVDDIQNLITSCFDCNRGKAGNSLNKVKVRKDLKEDIEKLRETSLQLKEYYKYKEKLLRDIDMQIDEIECYFHDRIGGYFTDVSIHSIKVFLKQLDKYEIMDSIDCAIKMKDMERAFKYMCGVCWNKIKNRSI